MRIAVSAAPSAVPVPGKPTSASQIASAPRPSDSALPPQTPRQAPEELWARSAQRPSLFSWILQNRLLVLGAAIVFLLGVAAILPAPGGEPSSQTEQSGFPGIGVRGSPGTTLATVQVPPRAARRIEPSRGPLTAITPSTQHTTSAPTAQNILVGLDLPAGVTATLPGHGQEGQQSFRSLLLAFALGVFLVYLVTASQLESLLNPLSLLFTVPMGLIAAAWGLYATGATLNTVALIGTILLAGILVNNAIVLIDAINNARARGTRIRNAMIEASRSRVRPIMITSIGTVLGLLPMAIGVGEGLGIRRPMTITVIAGLAVATFLVAVAAPVLYTLFDSRARKTT